MRFGSPKVRTLLSILVRTALPLSRAHWDDQSRWLGLSGLTSAMAHCFRWLDELWRDAGLRQLLLLQAPV